MSSCEELSAQFVRASVYVMSHFSSMGEDTLLQMYGYYKQATAGPCNTPKPSWFDFAAKSKWKAWKNCENLSKWSAMSLYVKCLSSVVQDWDASDANDIINGIAVSSMCTTEEDLPEDEKTIFDWVKEGSLDKLKGKNVDPNCKDNQGLTPLHWATDRGDLEIVRYLVEEKKANLNILDDEGQTPLHYAAACGYPDIVRYLIKAGADYNVVDNSNSTPKDAAENQAISRLFPN